MAGFSLWRLAPSVLALVFGAVASLTAAEPEIRNLSLRGLQIDGSTTLTIDGDNLGTKPELLLPFPAKATLKSGATDKQATFDIALGADVTPGYHHLRVVNGNALSMPSVIAVDRLPQKALTPSVEKVPVALHGTVAGSAIVETTFPGKAGEKVTIEVEAQRLGNKLRPVVHLYGPKRLQVAWAWGMPSLQGDARLETTLAEDGPYRIALHDAEYQAAANSFFRMRVGQWSYVDQVFPPAVGKGTANVELIGSAVARADVPSGRSAHWLPLAWPKNGAWSGPRPFVETSSRTELIEQPSAAKPQQLPVGAVGVSGRLVAPFEEDRYRVPVTAGSKVRFEVFADRIGSPLDCSLVVRNESGAEVMRAEDSPGTLDPALEYAVPAKVDAVIVGVVDSQGRGGPRGIYRLTVDPVDATGRNEFDLVTPERRLSIPADGRTVFPIWIERKGYAGPIELKADALPAGLKLQGTTIPAGGDGTLVTVTGSAAPISPAITTWQGKAADGRQQTVFQKNQPMEHVQPWLAAELGVGGSSAKSKEFQVDWKETKSDGAIVPGRKQTLVVKITRIGPAAPVRLALLTSQPPVFVANQPNQVDPNRNIRVERPIELAAMAVDGEVPVLIPADLPADVYDFAIVAESLAPNKKDVTVTAVTPVRRLPVKLPVTLKLESPARIDVKSVPKMGATFEIAGSVERAEGIASDVQVALTGLPAGATAAPVVVKAADKAFKLKVTLSPAVPAGEIKGLKLSSSITPAPKLAAGQRSRNNEIELAINVQSVK